MSEGPDLDQALGEIDLPRWQQLCVILTAVGALALGLPLSQAWFAPVPLPSLSAPGPSLDPLFDVLLLGQVLAFAGSFWAQRHWRRRAGAKGPAGAIRRTWLLRYALAATVCVLGGLAFHAAHVAGLLTEAPRILWLGLLPLLALLWMLWQWPDRPSLRKSFSRS